MSDGYLIREKGERKYFAMVPNFIDDIGLSQKAYRLYGHIKRVAGEKGRFIEGVDAMAKHCQMSKPTAIKAKRELEHHNLIEVVAAKDRTSPDELVILDVWDRNTTHFDAVKNEERGKYDTGEVVKNRERDAVKNRERKKNSSKEHKDSGQSAPTKIYSKVIQDCVSTLEGLEGYPKDERRNSEHLEKQCTRHPRLNVRREVEKFCNYYEEQGFRGRAKPRARLSKWLDNAEEWGRSEKPDAGGPMGRRNLDEEFGA